MLVRGLVMVSYLVYLDMWLFILFLILSSDIVADYLFLSENKKKLLLLFNEDHTYFGR